MKLFVRILQLVSTEATPPYARLLFTYLHERCEGAETLRGININKFMLS